MLKPPKRGAMKKLLHVVERLGLQLQPGKEMGFHTERGHLSHIHIITVEVPLRTILRQLSGLRRLSVEGYMSANIAHELGHYLVASPGRRHRKNYGIPSYRGRSDASQRRWDLDETKAVVVAHWLLAACGFGKEAGVRKQPLRTISGGSLNVRACRLEVSHWWRTEGREQVTQELLQKGIAIT